MLFLTLLALLYFLPTIIATNRGHGVTGVLLLNLFFGWTVIGWFALLIWSLLSYPRYYHQYYYPYGYWRRW